MAASRVRFNWSTTCEKEFESLRVGSRGVERLCGLLAVFEKLFDETGKVIVTSSPSYAPTVIAQVAEWMNETDLGIAASYVTTYTEKCHDAKFDIVIPNSKTLKGQGVDYKLNLNFNTNGKMAQQGMEIQIGSKSLAEYLIRRGAIPQQAAPQRRSARV